MLIVGSIFRDSAEYVGRYFDQVNALRARMPVRLVLAEGDSTDGSYELIEERLKPGDVLIRADHGGEKFPSIDHPQRWAQIAYVDNLLLDEVKVDDDDIFLYVESDLIWTPQTIVSLLKGLDIVSAVAASCKRRGLWYDHWGAVGVDGKRFTREAPYHRSLAHAPKGALVPIHSMGSCIAIRGEIFNQGVEFSEEDCIRGYCRSIRQHTALWLDTGAEVIHP